MDRSIKVGAGNPPGATDQPHPENYGIPQFLKAIQSGQNIAALGAF